MKWQIVTCDNSRHIVPAQKHLFAKYAPSAELVYIDIGNEPIETWTTNVLAKLDTENGFTIFGLDDFLPCDFLPRGFSPNPPERFDRIELCSKRGIYTKEEPYRVSCQFSMWRTEALVELLKTPRSPWQFEIDGTLSGEVHGVENPFRYINESAISKRRPGLINLCGLRMEDITELIVLGLVDESKVIYGWKGTAERTREAYGTKYREFY